MKTRTSLVALVALACASASLTMGCLIGGGCDPANNSYRAPVDFTPSSIVAVRTPSTCGVVDPAFTSSDTFSLDLTGATNIAPPYTTITVELAATVALNQPIPLNVGTNAENASGDGIQFSLMNGSNASELDANPLTSVVVTVTALPGANGQPLSAELQLTFADGRILDQVYTAPVSSVFVACSSVTEHVAPQ